MSDHRSRNSEISIEKADAETRQFLRYFDSSVVHQLDSETMLLIEVNGVPVASIACMDSALAELAAGWAFLNRYCDTPADFDRASANEHRASVMVRGGIDIQHRRAVLGGEFPENARVPEPWPRDGEWSIPEDVLLDILREAWQLFKNDRMTDGSIHAALASAQGVEVVAFDINPSNAVAKVLGWCLRAPSVPANEILIVNGLVTRTIVDAAARLGVVMIATPSAPTADAFLAARVIGMGIVGYMRHETVGVFGNRDLITVDDVQPSDT